MPEIATPRGKMLVGYYSGTLNGIPEIPLHWMGTKIPYTVGPRDVLHLHSIAMGGVNVAAVDLFTYILFGTSVNRYSVVDRLVARQSVTGSTLKSYRVVPFGPPGEPLRAQNGNATYAPEIVAVLHVTTLKGSS